MIRSRRRWLTAGILAVSLSACGGSSPSILDRRPRPRPTTTIRTTTTVKSTTTTTTTTIPTTTTTVAGSVNKEKPFAANSAWNTPTPVGTQWFNPPSILSTSDWWINGGWVPFYASATDPIWTFQMPDFIALAWNRNRPAQTFQMRAPVNIAPSADSDGQLVVVEPDGSYVEVWRASVNATTHIVTSNGPGWATGNAIIGTGTGGLVSRGGNNAGTRAANFSIQGGRISSSDQNGSTSIDHALVVCLPSSMLMAGNTYVSPATAGDGAGSGVIKSGTRIGIPAGVGMPAGLTPLAQKIFTATQKYGMFVGDFCGGGVPVLQSDAASSFWDSSLHLISPLLRIADYQP